MTAPYIGQDTEEQARREQEAIERIRRAAEEARQRKTQGGGRS